MALTNSASSGGTFVSLYKGYWGKRASEGVENAVSRERGGSNENAKDIIWELRYNTLSGIIKNAYIEEGKYGSQLILEIVDGDEVVTAKMKAEGSLAESFIKSSLNIDIDQPVELQAYINKKDRGALSVKQGGEKIGWAYTKEKPNGMPPAVKKTVKGKEKWDFSAVEEFLYEKLTGWCSQFAGAPVKEEATDTTATEGDLVF